MHPAIIGQVALWGTLVATVGATLFSAVGFARRNARYNRLGRVLIPLAFVLVSVSSASLVYLLVSDDFSVRYVAQRSARLMPIAYKIGAWWGGQEGSLLLWLWILLGYGTVVATSRPDPQAARLWPAALAVLGGVATFFATMVTVFETPFARVFPAPADGMGLNPLLQSPSMLAHPVALYLGYIGYVLPFAFGLAALVGRDGVDDGWIRVTRRWALLSWAFLGVGILLGGEWAYKELGWGGYWGWDPVENASLVPWLTGTALLHSGLAEERRGSLRRWNMVLAVVTFLLVLLGTFVTRSGILSSVHAFAESPTAPYFMAFIGVVGAASTWLILARWEQLGQDGDRDHNHPIGLISREMAFIAANMVLLTLAFAVAFGTAVPILSRLVGPGITVQAPYFERVSGPLFLLMLLLMGLGMAAPWQGEGEGPSIVRNWLRRLWPAAVPALAFGLLLAVGGLRRFGVTFGLVAAFLAGGVAMTELVRYTWARARRRRRPSGASGAGRARGWAPFGGLIAHLGLAVLAVGVVLSTAYQVEESRSLRAGETASLAGYTVQLEGLAIRRLPDATDVYASLQLRKGDRLLGSLEPAKRLYAGRAAEFGATSEVAVRRGLDADVYVALAGWSDDGTTAALEIYVNPMVNWIWIGGIGMILGALLALWPAAPAPAAARMAAHLLREAQARRPGRRDPVPEVAAYEAPAPPTSAP